MHKRSVVNTSPLIFLSKAGLIDLLRLSATEVFVPKAVALEILQRGDNDITARMIQETPWLKIVDVIAIPNVILSWDIGPGESSVLAHAYANPGMLSVIDDRAGRNCAETLGLPLVGTLGLVLIAKKRNTVPAARPWSNCLNSMECSFRSKSSTVQWL